MKDYKIKTVVHTNADWQIVVKTRVAQYPKLGQYYTTCSLCYRNGEYISLISKYSIDLEEASSTHTTISSKAKEFFDLKKIK